MERKIKQAKEDYRNVCSERLHNLKGDDTSQQKLRGFGMIGKGSRKKEKKSEVRTKVNLR